jgi:hypothetical protein
MDLTIATITAMRQQEESGYMKRDFLHQDNPEVSVPAGPLNVDVECRSKMTAWCYQVVDFCKFNRETVEISMNYLDRFLATPAGLSAMVDRKIYQLAAMTCLYTAVKIHEPEAMDPKLVSNLSRGAYTPEQIETMEACILAALQWRVNPPTALSFVRQFLDLIPEETLSQDVLQTAYDITKYQTELAVNEYDFVRVKPSVVAYAALMNALESVGLSAQDLSQIGYALTQAMGVSTHDDQMYDVQNWLYEAVIRQPAGSFTLAHSNSQKSSKAAQRSSFEVSPRSVSATR